MIRIKRQKHCSACGKEHIPGSSVFSGLCYFCWVAKEQIKLMIVNGTFDTFVEKARSEIGVALVDTFPPRDDLYHEEDV